MGRLMAAKPLNYFWDSCCFIAYLNDEKDSYDIPSLEQFLDEARAGKAYIYTSTVALAEVRPSLMKKKSVGSFSEFMEDFGGAIILLDPTPNVMHYAGFLRDLRYKKSNSTKRQLATPDAIMLATCTHLEDDLGVRVESFHTYDKGKRRSVDGGKGIPLLTYEEWCEGIEEDDLAVRTSKLPRREPLHPEPKLT